MNPFLNPMIGVPFVKNLLVDPGRLKRLSKKQMKKYQSKQLKKVLKYTYSVPIYKKKYNEAGVNFSDITSIDDIVKLPLISKQEIIQNYPDNIIPPGYDKSKANVVSTSGSSGKPVSIFIDFETLVKSLSLVMRQSRVYGFSARKVKFANVGTHLSGRIDQVYVSETVSKLSSFRKSDSYISLNAFAPINELVKKLNEFQPDIIYTYPIALQHLAYFKKKGYADNINPILLEVGGYSMDEYTRNYISDAFNCPVVNVYQSVESTSDIAFECLCGTWHINNDFYFVETVNEKNEVVGPDEKGHMVLTRLYGKGTPIVRYTGMDDWITIVDDYECECGLRTPILKNGVEGRISARIILPDGRVYPAASFAIISLVLNKLNTYKVRQFQIVQNKIDEIEIKMVIDDELRDKEPSVELIFEKIKQAYEKLAGPEVNIKVKEVKEIKSAPGKPLPLVISKVKIEDGYKQLEKQAFKKKK